MVTYLMLNLVFMAVVLALLWWQKALRWDRSMTVTLVVLMVCTAVFDSLIIASGIVGYDESKLLGVMIGAAPIEDFFYAILAVVMVPSLWHYLEERRG